jgi:hypothetical protein
LSNPPDVPSEPNPTSGETHDQAWARLLEKFRGSDRPSESDPQFEISSGGVARKDAIRKEFDKLLMAAATISMHRRQSHTMDESDFSNGYQHLLASREIGWGRIIIGSVGGIMSAAFVGIGSNLATGTEHVGPGVVVIISGVKLGILAILFTYLPVR